MKEIIENFKQQKEKFQEVIKVEFRKALDKFFEKYPKIEGIMWTQYTPYFNDGDSCEFSVHDPSFVFSKENSPHKEDVKDQSFYEEDYYLSNFFDEDEYVAVTPSTWKLKEKTELTETEKMAIDCDEISGMWCGELEDVFRAMFDDHVAVCIKRNGEINTTGVDHD